MRDIRVATVQFQHAPGDKAYNLGRIRHFVTEAARAGVELVAFPEMCLTGYWHVGAPARPVRVADAAHGAGAGDQAGAVRRVT
jgi:predicted amidohydrolase